MSITMMDIKSKTNGFLAFLLMVITVSFSPVVAEAETENFDISLSHRIETRVDESELRLTHTVTVTNKTNAALETLQFNLPVLTTTDLSARYPDDQSIPFTLANKHSADTGREHQYKSVRLDFPRSNDGRNQSWRFVITYTTTDGIRVLGNNLTLFLPNMDAGIADSWVAEVRTPTSLPAINYRPPAQNIETVGQQRRFIFRGSDLSGDTLGLSFAESTDYSVRFTTQLRNRSPWLRTYRLSLPGDLHNQTTYLDDLKPKPLRLEVDSDGNTVAVYRLWPFQSKSVSYEGQTRVEQLRYDASQAGDIDDMPEELSRYVGGGEYWTTQSEVGSLATSLIDPQKNAWENIRILHDYVRDEVAYLPAEAGETAADKVLAKGSGNAHNIADLLITMLRSQSIPARLVEGVLRSSGGLNDEPHVHAWVEAYVPAVGWVTLDPVWSAAFNGFGYSSFDRFASTAISADYQRQYYRVSSTFMHQITPQAESLPETVEEPLAITAAKRFIVLPGVVLDKFELTNNSGYIVDNVVIDGEEFGSLAPRSVNTRQLWQLGGFSGFSASVTAGEQDLQVVSTVSWWPIAGVGLIVGVVAVVQFYRYKSNRYVRKRLHGNKLH